MCRPHETFPRKRFRVDSCSGGALADSAGRIVGINTAVAGIGLGLVSTPVPLPAPLAARSGQRRALRVVEVVTGSPADQAGLRAGDLVLSAGRRPVADAQSLQASQRRDG